MLRRPDQDVLLLDRVGTGLDHGAEIVSALVSAAFGTKQLSTDLRPTNISEAPRGRHYGRPGTGRNETSGLSPRSRPTCPSSTRESEQPMTEDTLPPGETTSLIIRTMALLCVCNTMLEGIHAGIVPVTRTGDYSDVTVIDADGNRIPWNRVSHFDDDIMRDLMRPVVNRLCTFHHRLDEPGFLDEIGIWIREASRWDNPRIDESL